MEIAPKADETLKSVEEQNEAAMFVFISDLWLDRPEVMTRLKRLLLGKVSHKKSIIYSYTGFEFGIIKIIKLEWCIKIL